MTDLPRPAPMREVEGVDRRRLDEEIRPLAQPVVLRGAAADWPAVQAGREGPAAAVAYLKRFSHAQAFPALVGPPEIGGRFFYNSDMTGFNFTRGQSPLDPFLDRLLRDMDAERPYAMAVQSAVIADLLPGFVAENATPLVDDAVQPRMWLGNAIRVATHYDLMENIGIVMAGRRRFTLFPPEQVENLYMGPIEITPAGTPVSLVDPTDPDLARFPRYGDALASAQVAELAPGDAIYIPYHWWHAVDSLEPFNVFINYWWSPAPPGGHPIDAMLHALFALRRLPADQKRALRAMFDHLIFNEDPDAFAHLPERARGVLGEVDATLLERMRATLIARLGENASPNEV